MITKSNGKNEIDAGTARTLARLARIDPVLSGAVTHGGAKAQST